MTLPGGTVTFLFLDIEGSTGLLERIGTDYPQLLATYREIAERAVVGTLIAELLDAAGVAAETDQPALAEARRAGGEMTPQDAIAYALQPHHELAVAG